MANFKESLNDELTAFIRRQPIFYTASAAATGRINLSPKGMDTFRVLSPNLVGYLDFVGSGNETKAHLRHDGRLTIMFCSFDAKPLILRLYGKGEAVEFESDRGRELRPHFPSLPGERQFILLHVELLQTSCGFGVPRMEMVEERPTLIEWAEKKGPEALVTYRRKNNALSIDGLPIE